MSVLTPPPRGILTHRMEPHSQEMMMMGWVMMGWVMTSWKRRPTEMSSSRWVSEAFQSGMSLF